MSDYIAVMVEGKTYKIPRMWLVGATTGGDAMTYQEAIAHWVQQEILAKLEAPE